MPPFGPRPEPFVGQNLRHEYPSMDDSSFAKGIYDRSFVHSRPRSRWGDERPYDNQRNDNAEPGLLGKLGNAFGFGSNFDRNNRNTSYNTQGNYKDRYENDGHLDRNGRDFARGSRPINGRDNFNYRRSMHDEENRAYSNMQFDTAAGPPYLGSENAQFGSHWPATFEGNMGYPAGYSKYPDMNMPHQGFGRQDSITRNGRMDQPESNRFGRTASHIAMPQALNPMNRMSSLSEADYAYPMAAETQYHPIGGYRPQSFRPEDSYKQRNDLYDRAPSRGPNRRMSQPDLSRLKHDFDSKINFHPPENSVPNVSNDNMRSFVPNDTRAPPYPMMLNPYSNPSIAPTIGRGQFPYTYAGYGLSNNNQTWSRPTWDTRQPLEDMAFRGGAQPLNRHADIDRPMPDLHLAGSQTYSSAKAQVTQFVIPSLGPSLGHGWPLYLPHNAPNPFQNTDVEPSEWKVLLNLLQDAATEALRAAKPKTGREYEADDNAANAVNSILDDQNLRRFNPQNIHVRLRRTRPPVMRKPGFFEGRFINNRETGSTWELVISKNNSV